MRLVAEDIRLSAIWQALISEPLVRHTRPISYNDGRLRLLADSAAWASRVRQQNQALCQRLRRDEFFANLIELNVRVAPLGSGAALPEARKKLAPARLSARAIDVLRSTACTTRDPELQAAFDRLVRTVSTAPVTDKTR